MYDVLIIGAGPTGSSAAKELASNGYSVLLVEKFKMPRNKSCSGILIVKSINLIESYFGEYLPRNVMCAPEENKGLVFTNDEGKEYIFEQKGLNIWRDYLDHWLVKKAILTGAVLNDETVAINCEEYNDCVITTLKNKEKGEYTIKSKMVIDCSGAICSIKRKLISTPKKYIYTYQTFNKGSIELDYHYFYAYLQPQFSEYDAWFNVKDNYLILGVSVKDKTEVSQYYSNFFDYMLKEHNAKIDLTEKTEKWIMPHIFPGCNINYGIGRILFAGEAAGFLNPMGEGISAGLESGFAAAKAIQQIGLGNNFNVNNIYEAYKTNVKTLKAYMEGQWRFVASLSKRFSFMK